MKTQLNILCVIILCLFSNFSNSQQLFNIDWEQLEGNPASAIKHFKTLATEENEIITIGNFVNQNLSADIHISKVDQEGDTIFNVFYNSSFASNDYGVSGAFDQDGFLHVLGAVFKPTTNQYLPIIIKYDGEGGVVKQYLFDEPTTNTIPTEIFVDEENKILVTTATQNTNGTTDILTLKLDTGYTLEWVNTFDYANHNDIPFFIEQAEENTYQITGTSQNTSGDYHATIILLNAENGDSLYTFNSGKYPFDEIKDVCFDQYGNKYIAGSVFNSSTKYDLKVLALDSSLNLLWQTTYDGFGHNDIINEIFITSQGEIITTGSIEVAKKEKRFFIGKHQTNGNLSFVHVDTLAAVVQSAGHAISSDIDGNILIAGYEMANSKRELFIRAYNEDGLKQWRYSKPTNNIVTPDEIFTNENQIIVSGLSSGTTDTYYKLSLSRFNRNSTVVSNQNEGSFVANEIFIDFIPSAINTEFVNSNKIFGTPEEVLTIDAYNAFNNALSELVNVNELTFVKAVPHMKTSNQTSISRGGNIVYAPKFWAKMVLKAPDSTSHALTFNQLQSLEFINGYSLNRTFELSGPANDLLYSVQHSLQSTGYPSGHINVEPAWDISTGKPFVKVGVFDSGIHWKNEDFSKNQQGSKNPSQSIIKGGFDYFANKNVLNSNPFDDRADAHGTKVAGIIAANRNNQLGVAGIAGGDFSNHLGVSLYNYKLFGTNGQQTFEPSLDMIISSIYDGATYNPNNLVINPGLHVMNFSINNYSFTNYPNVSSNDYFAVGELEKAFRYAYKNEATVVGSRGNNYPGGGSEIFTLPTSYPDEMVISVSGAGQFGNYVDNIYHYGHNLDLIAPAQNNMIVTTWAAESQYGNFGWTSAAAPHVSGVAGLMYSYLNQPGCYSNISPEDVENIMQQNTFYHGTDSLNHYDKKNGYGLINAGGVLSAVEFPHYKIRHYEIEIDTSNFKFDGNHLITLDKKAGTFDSIAFSNGLAARFIVENTFNLNLEQNETVLGVWPRLSTTHTYKQYNDSVCNRSELLDFSYDTINNTVYLKGYVYEYLMSNSNIWVPIEVQKTGKAKLSFTAYTYNPDSITSFSYPCDSLPINSGETFVKNKSNIFLIYPNPSKNNLNILVEAQKTSTTDIFITDISGKRVQNIFKGSIEGFRKFTVDLNLAPGIYFVLSLSDKGINSQKLIISK